MAGCDMANRNGVPTCSACGRSGSIIATGLCPKCQFEKHGLGTDNRGRPYRNFEIVLNKSGIFTCTFCAEVPANRVLVSGADGTDAFLCTMCAGKLNRKGLNRHPRPFDAQASCSFCGSTDEVFSGPDLIGARLDSSICLLCLTS